jgi:hypothetical protein
MDNKQVHIIGGGTFSYLGSHLATSAPAFGGTARRLEAICRRKFDKMDVRLHLTRMAGGSTMVTNDDVAALLQTLIEDDRTKIIFLTAALVDFGDPRPDMKHGNRISTKQYPTQLNLIVEALPKVVPMVRQKRKDIFLVAFKQTCNYSEDQQYIEGLDLCKRASANLVLANDDGTRLNMVVTPEEARYHITNNRQEALEGLVEMAKLRSHLTFTRSTVVDGKPITWDSQLVPDSLRAVVNYCIQQGAYKPFNGSTAGHFACKLDDNTFLTSIRKTDFNDLPTNGLVLVKTDGPDSVLAYGAKPSVGGQSQRIVFHDHQEYDCIVHFHCPIKLGSKVPVASQREFECGSHQCGQNTSTHLMKFGNLSAVYLDQHGPNIVFHRSIDAQEVVRFIEDNFDLNEKTGGFVSIRERLETPNTLETAQTILSATAENPGPLAATKDVVIYEGRPPQY